MLIESAMAAVRDDKPIEAAAAATAAAARARGVIIKIDATISAAAANCRQKMRLRALSASLIAEAIRGEQRKAAANARLPLPIDAASGER